MKETIWCFVFYIYNVIYNSEASDDGANIPKVLRSERSLESEMLHVSLAWTSEYMTNTNVVKNSEAANRGLQT